MALGLFSVNRGKCSQDKGQRGHSWDRDGGLLMRQPVSVNTLTVRGSASRHSIAHSRGALCYWGLYQGLHVTQLSKEPFTANTL